jgi:glycosyltransferase involved in cell wall biosynthesis
VTSPLVSIIVPSYNAAPWLAQTLESALAQTHPTREIIVVDDGSTDSSLELARGFETRGVRVFAEPNRGASAARNLGLRHARGDFIQFLDADDLLAPDKISRQLERLSREPAGTVASAAWARFHADPVEARFVTEPAWRDFPTPIDFQLLHFNEGWMMPPIAWLTPQAVIAKAGPWDERLSLNDDGEYFCRVLLASAGIAFCADARCFYRSGLPGSLSRRKDVKSLRSMLLSIELCTETLERHGDTPAVRAALANVWQKLAYDLYPDLVDASRQAAARAREFGGANRPWEAGGRLKRLARLIGWRGAKRIQRRLERWGLVP